MPPALHTREEVLDRLMRVIRRRGFDGASLADLSRATGLGRSSLYHHFPDGKEGMVRAVLAHLQAGFRETVFGPLRAPGPARRRVEGMVETLDGFYRGGREACVLGNLVLGTSRVRFHRELRAILGEWIEALATALVDGGVPGPVARTRAADAIMRIEGALILAGGMGDPDLFGRALHQLPDELLAPVGPGG